MPSNRPLQLPASPGAPLALARLDRNQLRGAAAVECDLCIAFDTSLTARSAIPRGTTSQRAHGRITEATPERLVLRDEHDDAVIVRLLLPSALDLSPLVGAQVALELSHELGGRRPTVDAVLRDSRGRLLLWARDGALPGPRSAHGLAVRVTHDAALPRLVVAAGRVTASATSGGVAELRHGRAQLALVALRVEGDGASFLVVRC